MVWHQLNNIQSNHSKSAGYLPPDIQHDLPGWAGMESSLDRSPEQCQSATGRKCNEISSTRVIMQWILHVNTISYNDILCNIDYRLHCPGSIPRGINPALPGSRDNRTTAASDQPDATGLPTRPCSAPSRDPCITARQAALLLGGNELAPAGVKPLDGIQADLAGHQHERPALFQTDVDLDE